MNFKKSIIITALLAAAGAAYGGTVESPYEVGAWSGFKAAAVTYTFDDGYMPNLYSKAVPLFNSYGYKMTMYPCMLYNLTWSNIQTAASYGHEVGSHTVTHSDLSGLDEEERIYELSESQAIINSYIPGNQCLTIAYPYCIEGDETLNAAYYIAGRTCASTTPNPSTPPNLYMINCTILGTANGIDTTPEITAIDDAAAASGGWVVFLIHAIDTDNGYSPVSYTVLSQSVAYLESHSDTFWVNTFLNVVKYIKERDDVSVSETSNTGSAITVSVTDTLSDTIYNYPLTIRRPLPDGWGYVKVLQDGSIVDSNIVEVESTSYLMFDIVPDSGELTLLKTISPPEGLTGTGGSSMVVLDWNDNNESDLAGYNVYRSTTSGSGYNKLNTSLLTQSDYNDSNVALSSTYYYVVTAEDTNSIETVYSGEISVRTTDLILIRKCTVKAGKTAGIGTISFSGDMNATADDLGGAEDIQVTIDSGNMVNPLIELFPIDGNSFKNGKYNYTRTEGISKQSFKFNPGTRKFSFTGKNVDLTGIDCPLTIEIEVGDYIGMAEVNEAIVNRKKPIPINLLMGVADSLRVDKITVKQNTTKPASDSVTVKGGFSALDSDYNADANMVETDVNVILDAQTWTIPDSNFILKKTKFTCSKKTTENENGIAAGSFDFSTGVFTLSIKNADIDDIHGIKQFGINFSDVNLITDVNLP
jgi:hypothetical protein